jgi:splicing factor U2AF subunit
MSDSYRGGHRDERYRSSRHDERGGDREHRSDRDHYDGDRDRGGGNGTRRGGGDDRRGGDRDKYSRGGRDGDDGRHPSRYDSDRRRDHRGPRDDEHALPRAGGGTPREDAPPRGGDRRGRGGKGRDGMGTPERRSPTPEGAVPLSQRKRKASGWDVHAPGYEQYTALQAKQTGKALLSRFQYYR